MTENSEKKPIVFPLLFEGELGESLFNKPFILIGSKNELPLLLKKVEGMNDDRLLAIVTALLIEDRLDKLLSLFLPKYSKLLEASDFSFSMKINLLEALNFVPLCITTSAHCIRKIRNEFAHNLNKVNFSSIDDKFTRPLYSLCRTAYRKYPDRQTCDSLLDAFKKLSLFCIWELDKYTINIIVLRREISKEDFINYLAQIVDHANIATTDYVFSQPPKNVEIQSGGVLKSYNTDEMEIQSVEQIINWSQDK